MKHYSNKRIALTLTLSLLCFGGPFCSICLAQHAEKVPEPPLILLMNEAKKQPRKSLWTDEIESKRDLELTLRNYIEGIARDYHEYRNLLAKSDHQWLQTLLAVHRSKKGKKYSLASENTLVPRMALIRFAGKNAVKLIDNIIEKAGPPKHRQKYWQNNFGPVDLPALDGIS